MLNDYCAFCDGKKITFQAESRLKAKTEALKRFGLKKRDASRVIVVESELLVVREEV